MNRTWGRLEPVVLGRGSRQLPGGRGRRRRLPWVRERRSCCAWGCGRLPRRFRPHRLAGWFRRRANSLKFRDHRIGINLYCRRCQQATGAATDLHGDRDWLELVQRVTDREAALGSRHANSTGRLAARPKGRARLRSRWRRFKLNLHRWRGRREVIRRKRRATGQA